MKNTISALLFLVAFGCKSPTTTDNLLDQVIFQTDQISYTKSDSINIDLENKSYFDIEIGLRCGLYLEMFYQKKENNIWSDDLQLWDGTLRCPTIADTLQPNNSINLFIKSEKFNSTGTFRLGLNYYNLTRGAAIIKYSNPFDIR